MSKTNRLSKDFKKQIVSNVLDILAYYGSCYRNNNLVPDRIDIDGVKGAAIGYKRIRNSVFSIIGTRQPYIQLSNIVATEREVAKWSWRDPEIREMARIVEQWPKIKKAMDDYVKAEQAQFQFDASKDPSSAMNVFSNMAQIAGGGREVVANAQDEDHVDFDVAFANGDKYICRVTAAAHDPLDRFGLGRGEVKSSYRFDLGYVAEDGRFVSCATMPGYASAPLQRHIDELCDLMVKENPDLAIPRAEVTSQGNTMSI